MYKYYITTFIIAACASFLLTPLVRRISLRRGWLDRPNWRKINKKPMPLLGGLALYIGFAVSLLFVIFKEPFRQNSDKFFGFLASSFIIVLIGIADDTKGLTPRRKLFYQIAASAMAVICGYAILKISNPLGGYFHAPILIAFGLSIFWMVGFTNAVNLMDGLDGLAAGVSSIIAVTLFFASLKINNSTTALLSVALAGSSLGFLRHNFYPAKIFMGDTGSMFLGFALALISIEGAYKGVTFITVLIPIIAMAVPFVDTALAILRRLLNGNSVFKADKEHIHHKLLIREGTQRKAVLTLYFLTISFGLIAIALSGMKGVWAFFAILITAILTLRWIINAGLVDFIRKINGD